MNIYLPNGYLDIRKILGTNIPFIFIVGGRGTGKTYGALKTIIEDEIQFMYLRRTQSQVDLVNKPEFTPFKKLNSDHEWKIGTSPISKYNSGFYRQVKEGDAYVNQGAPIGYTGALSTISNIRGFDASDVELMVYDEFIPERHERPIKDEGSALLNGYETVNRNRELNGGKPLQLLCLANANNLANPIFMELNLVRTAENMLKKGREVYISREKGVMMIILTKSKISEQKSETALYRLTKGSEFERMSIGNEFSREENARIVSRPITEYKPIVTIGEITIYEHKSKHTLYITGHRIGNPPTYSMGDMDRKRFQKQYYWVWDRFLDNEIEFEEFLSVVLLTKVFK